MITSLPYSRNVNLVSRMTRIGLLFLAIWYGCAIMTYATEVTWSQSSIPASIWSSVSISSNGSVQSILTSTSVIYQSFNFGNTWSNKTIIGDTSWSKIDISETGKYQTATVVYCLPWVSGCVSHYLYRSDDYGRSFITVAYSAQWTTVSLSGSGQYQAASEYTDYSGNIALSSDYGLTWKSITPSNGSYWCYVVISYTGKHLTALTDSSNMFYISSNYGSSWFSVTTTTNINIVAMSNSGVYQLGYQSRGGYLYRSTDYGKTWDITTISSPSAVCLSNDGKIQVASAAGSLYVSTDYGLTFSTQAFISSWQLVDISSSGNYVVGTISSSNAFNIYIDAQPSSANPIMVANNSNIPTVQSTTSEIDIITTIAGTGSTTYSGDGGAATSANLYYPVGVAVDAAGNVYIGDSYHQRIRKVSVSTGIITSIAGSSTSGSYSGDGGAATSANLYYPVGVAVDASDNVYIADNFNHRIRKVTVSTGIITLIAGTGASSYSGDGGSATSAALYGPTGVAVDATGNVYIGDTRNYRIRKVTVSTGIITLIAGTGSTTYSGDGGAATSANLYYPRGIALDASGNVYIADAYNHRIRKVTVSTGIIALIAGTGSTTYSGDNGAATSANLNYPSGVAVDATGNVYIADTYNYRIRKVSVSTGIITSIAGSSTSGSYSGDGGAAISATLNEPVRVVVDASGNIYIADFVNNRIRKVTVTSSNPSLSPSMVPSQTPSLVPSASPSRVPSQTPSLVPSSSPSTVVPSQTPSLVPSASPSRVPSQTPSLVPSRSPSRVPSQTPSLVPSSSPSTVVPSQTPSLVPSSSPSTVVPSQTPSLVPSASPSRVPSQTPSLVPSASPSRVPSQTPSLVPSASPSRVPSQTPSLVPSASPSRVPSQTQSLVPSASPSTVVPLSPPSLTPNDSPSYLPSLNSVLTPSLSSSAYPTYSTSVDVYFMVKHVLSGISTAAYNADKASNDAIFKQAVTRMLGYDSKVDDVSINLVADVVSSRSLLSSATVVETDIVYSITTPTYIFNDTNYATAMFVQALNESIASGAFDALLHADTNNIDWQSAKTEYVIFSIVLPTSSPTSSPMSSPSSVPTSSPTKIDGVAANLLDVPLDNRVAKEKIQYFLGAFVGYFLSIYICLYLFSFLRYGKHTSGRLYNTSYQSYVHITNSIVTTNGDHWDQSPMLTILSDIHTKNAVIQSIVKLEEELRVGTIGTNRVTAVSFTTDKSLVNSTHKISITNSLNDLMTTKDEHKYSKGYHEYVQQQRALLGCSQFLYPDGYALRIPCTNIEIQLPPGRFENILLFLCHNHPLFRCFYFMDGSKLGAHGTRILYIGKDITVFVLYQFSNMLLQHYMLDGIGLGTFINLFIITPSAVSVGLILRYLYTCPFTEKMEFQRKYAKYQSMVLFLGRLAIIPIMVIMFGSLIIACLFSSGRNISIIIINYLVSVQLYGILLETVKAALLFVDNYCFQLSVLGIDIFCIGKLYKERIATEQLVVDRDFAFRIHTYLFGLVQIQKILRRDDAVKAKWITERKTTSAGEDRKGYEDDVEMRGAGCSDENAFAVQLNPLTKAVHTRNSATFSIDSIFGGASSKTDDDAGGHDVYIDTSIDRLVIIENPIHASTGKAGTIVSNDKRTNKHEEVVSSVDDDEALYFEYQALQNDHDESLYDMSNDGETAMSFEDWKTRRKQFKQGTRGSFVKAFQVFEERELERSDQSASVKNTMKLHSYKAKNVLARAKGSNRNNL